jgi:3-hydroxyacyl-[acyl-carrier-protein] dehydratase
MAVDVTIADIQQKMRHRYPFLFVDRITEVVPNVRAKGFKNVTVNEPFFQGHFPNEPVMPGVLIIEAMAQTGAMMFQFESGYLVSVEKAKFFHFVVPGDRLDMSSECIGAFGQYAKARAFAHVNGKKTAQAEVTYYLTQQKESGH